jgi:hypothetical protein
MMAGEIGLPLQIVDEAYERKAWHAPNLRGSIRGLDAARFDQLR